MNSRKPCQNDSELNNPIKFQLAKQQFVYPHINYIANISQYLKSLTILTAINALALVLVTPLIWSEFGAPSAFHRKSDVSWPLKATHSFVLQV
jgi:hypothetical protein